MDKIVKIKSCNQCLHWGKKKDLYFCEKEGEVINYFPIIPDWCPLEDAKEPTNQLGAATKSPDLNCEDCNGTGWYGDNGPGIKGNREYCPCDCTKNKS